MMEDTIRSIVEDWFLSEPALFAAFCTHELAENTRMTCPMRCGRMRIEYNPEAMEGWSTSMVEERLKFEVIRILLGHPYQRQPYKAVRSALGMASDVTLSTLYRNPSTIFVPEDLKVEKGLCFEEYYTLVKAYLEENREMESPHYEMENGTADDGGGSEEENARSNGDGDPCSNDSPEDDGSDASGSGAVGSDGDEDEDEGRENTSALGDGDAEEEDPWDDDEEQSGAGEDVRDESPLSRAAREDADCSALWEEDQLSHEQVREVIARIERSRQWGSLAGSVCETIRASNIVRMDYRRALSMFRASVLSSKRHLTRMLPSRRYGFDCMGSKREFSTRLLVAVDVSGSVLSEQVSQALSIIGRFFKYGVEQIDVIQFDSVLHGEPRKLRRAEKAMEIEGRGGTDFQAAIDCYCKADYDGLIIITDGYAEEPVLPEHTRGRILWMLYDEDAYRNGLQNNSWIKDFPRSRYIVLPPVHTSK